MNVLKSNDNVVTLREKMEDAQMAKMINEVVKTASEDIGAAMTKNAARIIQLNGFDENDTFALITKALEIQQLSMIKILPDHYVINLVENFDKELSKIINARKIKIT